MVMQVHSYVICIFNLYKLVLLLIASTKKRNLFRAREQPCLTDLEIEMLSITTWPCVKL